MADEESIKLVCFESCGEKFAFNMDFLVEIVQVRYAEIVPVFLPMPLLRGEWQYRGITVYILELRDFFGLEYEEQCVKKRSSSANQPTKDLPLEKETQENPLKSILVVKIRDRIFGLLTDTVFKVELLTTFYEYPDMISTLPRKYFAGLTIIDGELVIILSLDAFLSDYELELLSTVTEQQELTEA